LSGILLAVIAAVTWGSIVLVGNKLGGDDNSQTVGTTFGALIFAVGVYIFTTPHMSAFVWIVGIISGIFWAIGQKNQFGAVKYLGVAKTVPMSTGLQLIGTSLFGALFFHEWSTKTQVIIGILALVCIIAGAALTSFGQKTEDKEGGKDLKKGLLVLLVSTIGYVVYVVIIKWSNISGWAAILPQAVGMVIAGIFLTIRHHPFNKYAARNLITGLIWATGNLTLLLSLPSIGVATSFSLSQTGIVISTLGGIFLLGEKTSKKQVISVIIGCLLIIAGGVLVGLTKK
jgi:glucose uptake protein